eukprot:Skav205399  [mRNA]  locus=scaffold1642:336926:341810:+ [translate_table: standard]
MGPTGPGTCHDQVRDRHPSLRIRRFVEFELKRRQQPPRHALARRPVNQQSVGCLAVLWEQLQTELSFALVQPTLNTHALFEILVKNTGGALMMEKSSQYFEKKTLAMDDWDTGTAAS